MSRSTFRGLGFLATAIVALAACGGSGGATTIAPGGGGAGGSTSGPADSSGPVGAAAAGGSSNLNLRIANFISQTGTAGPALDIYDDALAAGAAGGSAPQPLISNLAFGAVSAYFHPHVPADGGYIHLSALKAGQDPVTDVGQAGGFFVGANDTAQATIVLTYDGQGPLSANPPLSAIGSISFSSLLETGGGQSFPGDTAPLAPAPPAGQGMFLARDSYLPGNLSGETFLMINDSCDPPLNGDTNRPGVPQIFAAGTATIQSAFALFPATAGSHQVSVVYDGDSGLTCKDLTAKQGTTTVQLTAGEEALTFVYGTGPTDLHLAIAPIAP